MAAREGLAERLRTAREEAGFTQQQVADWLGVRRPAIAEIEGGSRSVKSDELVRLASLYGRSVGWLAEGELRPQDNIAAALFRADDRDDPALHREAALLAKRCATVFQLERIATADTGSAVSDPSDISPISEPSPDQFR